MYICKDYKWAQYRDMKVKWYKFLIVSVILTLKYRAELLSKEPEDKHAFNVYSVLIKPGTKVGSMLPLYTFLVSALFGACCVHSEIACEEAQDWTSER